MSKRRTVSTTESLYRRLQHHCAAASRSMSGWLDEMITTHTTAVPRDTPLVNRGVKAKMKGSRAEEDARLSNRGPGRARVPTDQTPKRKPSASDARGRNPDGLTMREVNDGLSRAAGAAARAARRERVAGAGYVADMPVRAGSAAVAMAPASAEHLRITGKPRDGVRF